MKIILSFALMIFMLTATAYAEERLPTISVSGEGVVEVSPDRATISIGVISRDKDVGKVQSENARIANDIIKSVTALGVDRKNIRTGNYSFRQIFRNDQNRRRIFDGYEVNNTVTIIVDDLILSAKLLILRFRTAQITLIHWISEYATKMLCKLRH